MDGIDRTPLNTTSAPPPAYRQIASIGGKTTFLLKLQFVIAVVSIVVEIWYIQALQEPAFLDGSHPVDYAGMAIGILSVVVFISTIVCWCRWKHRAYSNVPILAGIEPRTTPSRAVWAYFIPILNLFRPFRAMKDIWNGSQGDPMEKRVVLINWWWALWLIMGYADRMATRITLRAETIDDLRVSSVVLIIASSTALFAIAVAVRLVNRIIDIQASRAAELGLTADKGFASP